MHQRRHQVYLLLFFVYLAVLRTVAQQKTTVINLIYKCRAPVAFTRHVCNACTICRDWNEWCAMPVLYVMLEMNDMQCLYYMLCLKWMVCNACTICYAWNEWCAMLVLCAMLEMNGVQCLYYVLCLKWMVCNACNMCYVWNEWCAMLVLCIAYTLVLRKILAHILFMSLELTQNRLHAGFKSSLLQYNSTKTIILPQLIVPLSSSRRLPHCYPSFTR